MERNAEAVSVVVWKNSWGWMGLLLAGKTIVRLILPRRSRGDLVRQFSDEVLRELKPLKVHAYTTLIDRYLDGRTKTLALPFELCGTDFQRRIWHATAEIPYGQTQSYAWVAERAGHPRAVRAAGSALGANPIPLLVPCHRVTAKNTLGGFGAGLLLKRKLLSLERGREERR